MIEIVNLQIFSYRTGLFEYNHTFYIYYLTRVGAQSPISPHSVIFWKKYYKIEHLRDDI